jgi:pSer/pThr/pTyr-binding forkhead associated (FHA) protein
VDRNLTSAGRNPDSDIFLDDLTVSRRHAEFEREDGEFRIVDVGSLNGTYVNRHPVDSVVLANHDKIQIGTFRLVFLARVNS